MPAVIDASVLVRYLTGDPPRMAESAARLIDSDTELLLTDVTIVETCYVLESVYRVARDEIVDHMMTLIAKENINTPAHGRATLLTALLLCKGSRRVSFADSLVWATARESAGSTVYTFDERFPRSGIEVRRPSA